MGRSSFDNLRTQLLDDSKLARSLRSWYHRAKSIGERYPTDLQAMLKSDLYNAWWYYSVELIPGATKVGIYPANFPLLPRIMMRNCNLKQMDCLDLGSMEGLIPTLMCRQGAKKVLATDATFHCYQKLCAVKHYYDVHFRFRQVGLMYGLSEKLRGEGGFDLINLSGILYHVFSPMHTIAGARALLRKNGLMIVATNVVNRPDFSMEFNDRGKLQAERNTFWYPSIPLFEYLLRYFKLLPIDLLYLPHAPSDRVRFTESARAGYLCVICRATDEVALPKEDEWAIGSMINSWEWIALCDRSMLDAQPTSTIKYKGTIEPQLMNVDQRSLDLYKAVSNTEPILEATQPQDSNWLHLEDQF
jgi:2-polyprenyl-3-methyl-5-hydroxy-6-metoxy-1,4-benzoquinol methylase